MDACYNVTHFELFVEFFVLNWSACPQVGQKGVVFAVLRNQMRNDVSKFYGTFTVMPHVVKCH